jgi:hypothetical protein
MALASTRSVENEAISVVDRVMKLIDSRICPTELMA